MNLFYRVCFKIFKFLQVLGILSVSENIKPSNSTFCFLEFVPKKFKIYQYFLLSKPLRFYILESKNKKIFFEILPVYQNIFSQDGIDDKFGFKKILKRYNDHFPRAIKVVLQSQLGGALDKVGLPLVIKPRRGSLSKGVSIVRRASEINRAFQEAKKYSKHVLLEKHCPGNHYRITIIGNNFFAVERKPYFIISNGKSTIRELIKKENKKRKQLYPYLPEAQFKPKKLNEVKKTLKKLNLNFDSILRSRKRLFLDWRVNLDSGASSWEITEQIPFQTKKLFISLAQKLNLNLVGFDIIAQDLTKSLDYQKWWINEANTYPFLNLHQYPYVGKPKYVGKYLWQIIEKKLK